MHRLAVETEVLAGAGAELERQAGRPGADERPTWPIARLERKIEEVDGLLAWVACIADALPVQGYVDHCQAAGMVVEHVEDQGPALVDLVVAIRDRLATAELVLKLR